MNVISVNNLKVEIEEGFTISNLLDMKKYPANKIAVAVNGDFIARHEYANKQLFDGDKIDILAPVQGG